MPAENPSSNPPAPHHVPGHAPRYAPRHDWTVEEIITLYEQPFNDLLHEAHRVHRNSFDANEVQLSTLLNIKSGDCPEDCAYCPQSARYRTGVDNEALMSYGQVMESAQRAKDSGASRFCMGAAWRSPKDKDLDRVAEMVSGVKTLGLETCVTLGMLKEEQAGRLKQAGLDYYNHNLDTSEEFYGEIISTRTYQDRLDTLAHVRDAGIKVCCGGILGMGESVRDRAAMLRTLACLPEHPESVPINMLVRVAGVPLADQAELDHFDLVRTIACTRITMPFSAVRLSAGRTQMSDAVQALCFYAGANSVFYGEKLLTTGNPQFSKDQRLFEKLGISARP